MVYGLWSEKAFCQEKPLPVTIDGDKIDYSHEEGKVFIKGNVRLQREDIELFCDEAQYDTTSGLAHVKGRVKLVRTQALEAGEADSKGKKVSFVQGEVLLAEQEAVETGAKQEEDKKITTIEGDDMTVNFHTKSAQIVNIELEDPPVYGKAPKGEKIGDEKYLFEQGGYVTTCNLKKPHYRLSARRIVVYPQEKIVAKNVTFRVGNVPIMYLPYFQQSLKDKFFPVQVVPGKSDDLGIFVLNSIRYDLNEYNRGKLHGDWYTDRKWGLGITHVCSDNKIGENLLKYYAIQDELYDLEVRGDFFDRYPGLAGVDAKYLEDDRYKAQFAYDFDEWENLSVKAEFNKFSDDIFMKDFFELEYEIEPKTKTYALIDYSLGGTALSLLTQKRANHFFSEVQYLPQLECDLFRRGLGDSNFYLETTSVLSNLNSKIAHSDEDSDVVRAYLYNNLTYDNKIKWLSINPYVGGYTNFYSKNALGQENIYQGAFEMGTDLNTKLYKVLAGEFNLFGRHYKKMRHVLTPTLTYSYQHDPVIPNSKIMQFDGKDTTSRSDAMVFKLENKLQAKSEDNSSWDFLYFSPSLNYNLKEEGKGSYISTVNTRLEVYPIKGISFTADKVYTVAERRITSFNFDLTWKDESDSVYSDLDKFILSLGHRYSRHSSTQSIFDLNWQMLPKLHFKTYLCYEHNTQDFKERDYGFRADLHCWWLDFGVNIDKQQAGVSDFQFYIVFRLKDFPDTQVEFEHGYHGAKHTY